MEWKTVLASITGSVDEELLLRNEYLVTENRIVLLSNVDGAAKSRNGRWMALRLSQFALAGILNSLANRN